MLARDRRVAHRVQIAAAMSSVRTMLVAVVGLLAAATPTRARPPTVIAALVDGDPASEAVEQGARDVAAALHIDRDGQAQRWQTDLRDDYEQPPWREISDAQREIAELCPDAMAMARLLAPPEASRLKQAAWTLFRVTGEVPAAASATATGARGPGHGRWTSLSAAAKHAAECLGRGDRAQRVTVTVFARHARTWTLFANGTEVATASGDRAIELPVEPGQALWLHARCDANVRCSRTVHLSGVPQSSATIAIYIDALGARLSGRMGDGSIAVSYASPAERNAQIARDAGLAADALAAAHSSRGEAIAVMSEGADLRLVRSDDTGALVGTVRTSRADVVTAAERLVGGDSEPASGRWQPGKARVVVQVASTAPAVAEVQSTLDAAPVTARDLCKARGCAFASPPGKLRMRFDETARSGALEETIELTQDTLVTVRPGRRYWAKHSGKGLIVLGMGGIIGAMIPAALEGLAGKGACALVPTSGPDDTCDNRVEASTWQTATFFGSAGAVVLGVLLYRVIHKKPRVHVGPLGSAVVEF